MSSPSQVADKKKTDYCDSTFENLITKKKHPRNILWFNPPYSKSFKTKIRKFLLQLVKIEFSKRNKFYKIFTRNIFKLSYSYLPSIKTKYKFYQMHHQKIPNMVIINKKCPMNGACLKKSLVCYSTITCKNKMEGRNLQRK